MQPILNLENVTRRYGRKLAVDSANFHLHQGKAACLLGPSGCGKSTILRMIAGLEALDDGTIHIAQNLVSSPKQSIAPERRGVGLVFQDNALFPHLNVTDNIGFGLKNSSKAQKSAQISRLLDQFHISHLAKSWPHMLSGGEQQRVAIARALAREPALLLLDEPFSGLDGFLKESVREAVLRDLRQAGASFLIVTHDPDEALAIADDLILMAHGKILQTGSPEHCYHHPSSITAARLLGEMLLFPAEISGGELSCAWGKFDAAGFAGGKAQFGLRPEALSPRDNGVSAHVQSIKFAGGNYRLSLELGGTSFTIRLPQLPANIGSTLSLGFDRRNNHVFQEEI